jgi:hypothetical protein
MRCLKQKQASPHDEGRRSCGNGKKFILQGHIIFLVIIAKTTRRQEGLRRLN